MRDLREAAAGTLEWSQPSALRRQFELRVGEELFGRLHWEKAFGSLAVGEAVGGTWTFKRSGFLNPMVTVRVAGAATDLAVFRPRWRGDGTIEFADGRRYQWQQLSFWGGEWGFASDQVERLVHFKTRFALLKHAAIVQLEQRSRSADLPLLVLLGWYLLILMADDAGGVAAAAAAG